MAYYIYLVNDPVSGPMHGQNTGMDSLLVFRSIGNKSCEARAPFELRFEPCFAGKYLSSESTKCEKSAAGEPIVFESKRVDGYYEVRIKLKPGIRPPNEGYRYDVIMTGRTWDTGVVPRKARQS